MAEIGSNGIVVVADDDPDFGARLQQMIQNAGRTCYLVHDGGAALEQADDPNVLIFDLKAPLIQGVEVYSRLRQAGKTVPTIIITASGSDYHDTLEAMRDVAITGILNKPFDPMALLNRLDHLVA